MSSFSKVNITYILYLNNSKNKFILSFLLGIHPWIIYALVGLLLCIMCHRERLPLTMKSCVYPLIGDCIFGWIGDLIDIITIMCSLFGVCVNLVIASRQMNMGLSILCSQIDPDNIMIQVNTKTLFLTV